MSKTANQSRAPGRLSNVWHLPGPPTSVAFFVTSLLDAFWWTSVVTSKDRDGRGHIQLCDVHLQGGEKQGKVTKLSKNEVLMLNIGSMCTGARIIAVSPLAPTRKLHLAGWSPG